MPVNGAAQEYIAINDRGLAYGDGLFETIRLHHHRPVLLKQHLDRIQAGSKRLQIGLDREILEREIAALAATFPADGVLKIIVTRGAGGRGYRPGQGADSTRILSLHPLPDHGDSDPGNGIGVFVCRQRLALQPALAGLKHLNRLEQVMASLEWPDDSLMEGLMLDMDGNVIEGTRSNLFWAESGKLFTPSLARCGVDGIMRRYLMTALPEVGEVAASPLSRILAAEEAFVCNSVFGIWPVRSIHVDGHVTAIGKQRGRVDYAGRARDLFRQLLDGNADG